MNYTAIMTGSERVSSIQGYEGRTTSSGSETKKARSRVRVRRSRATLARTRRRRPAARVHIRSVGETIKDARPRSQRQKSVDRMEEKASWNCPHVEFGFGVEGTICSLGSRPTGRKAQRHPLPSPSPADNAHSSTCLTAPPLCHTRIRSQSRRDAGRLVAWLSARLSLSQQSNRVLQTKPSRPNA